MVAVPGPRYMLVGNIYMRMARVWKQPRWQGASRPGRGASGGSEQGNGTHSARAWKQAVGGARATPNSSSRSASWKNPGKATPTGHRSMSGLGSTPPCTDRSWKCRELRRFRVSDVTDAVVSTLHTTTRKRSLNSYEKQAIDPAHVRSTKKQGDCGCKAHTCVGQFREAQIASLRTAFHTSLDQDRMFFLRSLSNDAWG